jgi:hypothetical protein
MENKIKENIGSVENTVKHIREVNSNSRVAARSYALDGGLRDRILPPEGAEKAVFPVEMVPQFHTECFIGRSEDIGKIHAWINHSEPGVIRNYHLYGRRGIGEC